MRAAKADTFVWTSTEGRTTWQNFKWVSHHRPHRHGPCGSANISITIIIRYFFPPKSGQPSRRPEDACNSPNFDAHATDSITLVGKSLIAKIFQVFAERPSAISR